MTIQPVNWYDVVIFIKKKKKKKKKKGEVNGLLKKYKKCLTGE